MKAKIKTLGGVVREFTARSPEEMGRKARLLAGTAEQFDVWVWNNEDKRWERRMSITRVVSAEAHGKKRGRKT